MGGKQSKKLVSNRPPPRAPMTGPAPVRMMPKSKKRLIPPDGGWGWMVVLGACISLFFFPSVTVAYGVMFKSHLEAMGAGATEFTIIGNGLSTIWSFAAVFMAPLAELFGARSLTVLGGLLGFLTLILVAFSTSIITFTVVYSILGGISSSLCAFFGVVLIPKYFDKRKGLANGLVVSVSAFGKIVMAPLTRLLLEQYGYRWACLMVGALCLHTCISGMLYQPAEWHLIPDPNDSEENELQSRPPRANNVAESRKAATSGCTAAHGAARRVNVDEEEDDNIIFVMPTTPQMPQPCSRDDEVVLFSRSTSETHSKGDKVDLKLNIIRMDSTASLYGSLPMLTPIEEKKIDDDDNEEDNSCCSDFFLFKVFRLLDYGLLQEPYFHLIAWPNAIVIAAYVNLMYALPGYVLSLGFSYYQSAFAISAFSVMEVVFRLGIALLSDFSWFPNELVYTSGFVLATVSVGFLTMIPSYEWIVACVAVKGMAMSMIHVNSIHVIVRYLGTDRYAQVIGFFSLLNGVMMVAIGTTAGFLRDYFGSYEVSFFLITAVFAVSASVWISWHCYKAFEIKYRKIPVHTT
ncbi:monocarboxylate transporter 7-like isoform X3 [Portunus trituberculatus]|uniref:monocarboxylate transporter 7-like isoform X3 n=1 Tax=Portunus trituberculatus TaxID=210409 RepID=UPI001E1D1EA0|nr:monocarboxylate transporter 7-like isoform X3 [Portunus trituberculatus]